MVLTLASIVTDETLALREEAWAVQEKMFIIFYASLAKTGWIRAVEIVIKPMTA